MANRLNDIAISMLIVLTVLQVADVLTTYYIVKRGIGYESNRAMAWLIARLGLVAGLVLAKAAIVLLLYLLVLPDPHAAYVLAALIGLYTWVLANNAGVIRRART